MIVTVIIILDIVIIITTIYHSPSFTQPGNKVTSLTNLTIIRFVFLQNKLRQAAISFAQEVSERPWPNQFFQIEREINPATTLVSQYMIIVE